MSDPNKQMVLVLDDPVNCAECPCLSGYGKRCMAANTAFDSNEMHEYLSRYPNAWKPEWCPLIEFNDFLTGGEQTND